MRNIKDMKELPHIGIIGCGPRGLSALESLYRKASLENVRINVTVFEETDQPGAGPVYDTEQPETNWLNVAERAVDIWAREESKFDGFVIPAFPTFQEWIGYVDSDRSNREPDFFPPRALMGKYLRERYESIAGVLKERQLIMEVHGKVVGAVPANSGIILEVLGGERYKVDEAVLAIGHQPIKLDGQLLSWQSASLQMDSPELFTDPYPIARIMETDLVSSGNKVAIRGFGLAMIDVARALSIGNGGRYELVDDSSRQMNYIASGNEPKRIVPFSLDGLPMAPKPLNLLIDTPYVPSKQQLARYTDSIEAAIGQGGPPNSTDFLIEAISPIVSEIYRSPIIDILEHEYGYDEIRTVTEKWLRDGKLDHELILPLDLTASEMLESFCAMATGHGKVSLDYCIGHVWRHCQPTMYRLLSFAQIDDDVIVEIVGLDERLKRYSYGPPVDSLQQMLALERAGILDLTYVNDPDIELTESGWTLKNSKESMTVGTMVNSVLDSPQILKVAEPLPKGLIQGANVEALHDKLGIRTAQDALVEFDNRDVSYNLAVLGRLAKGTLIGVDAIAECFGVRSELWAQGVIERIGNGAIMEDGEEIDSNPEPL